MELHDSTPTDYSFEENQEKGKVGVFYEIGGGA
jgi:hypothetical protein